MKKLLYLSVILCWISGCRPAEKPAEAAIDLDSLALENDTTFYREKYRPQFHFTPREEWMNDPNGMVYYEGEYHLFYQYYPEDIVWGPMHWGHAISKDLVHWAHMPIAIYPDTLGWIFSGSAVVDSKNTSGLGDKDNPPLVAIYTYHSSEKEKAGRTDFQYQGIAYSTDNGRTWDKYEGNPVLKNQGVKDFRDPKVFWHKETSKWIMSLAAQDHIEFWGSPDLKNWSKLSDFGKDYGSHGGVWECPDLIQLPVEGQSKSKWMLIVSINPGGPNGGSATQYFIGDFNGKTFKADADRKTSSWVDYGPDNYAGVTWSNAPDNRKIFAGWMSNWAYANQVPSERWRGGVTVPRDLVLSATSSGIKVKSRVSPEFMKAAGSPDGKDNVEVKGSLKINGDNTADLSQSVITGTVEARDFSIELTNTQKQKVIIGYDSGKKQFYIDRSKSGALDFSEQFKGDAWAPRLSNADKISFTVVVDVSSVEVFFDDGLTAMTALFYPDEPMKEVYLKAASLKVEKVEARKIKSIW